MCAALKEIMKEDFEKEYQQGMQQGTKKGADQERITNIRNLMKNLELTVQKAMDALSITDPDERKRLMGLI